MSPIQRKNLQTAQGMVEFALVLPILLLVIFGIFAFGHLFFAYSSVVSASREASRWASAVGVADSLRPRFEDCNAIRATAVRVGTFAGVAAVDVPAADVNTPGIYVGYIHTPGNPSDPSSADYSAPFDDCSDDQGPAGVAYGDLVYVRVTVDYTPIVPLVPIPSFPLTATTARTIIRSLPVGEAPTAAPACPSTAIVMEFLPYPYPALLPASPVVGQRLDVRIRVMASDGSSPVGRVDINDELGHSCSVSASSALPGQICTLVPAWPDPLAYTTVGTHLITARYDPGNNCFQPSEIIDEPLDVIQADTIVQITSDLPDPSFAGSPVVVSFKVIPLNPGLGIPTGMVTVTDQGGQSCTGTIAAGAGSCTIYPQQSGSIVAVYGGDINYNPSPPSALEPHTVSSDPITTPTLTATATPGRKATPTITPTRTVTPPHPCPIAGAVDFNTTNAMEFQISNTGGVNTNITSITVTWNINNKVVINPILINFGTASGDVSCASAGGVCLWQTTGTPPTFPIGPGTAGWNTGPGLLAANASKYMLIQFDSGATGTYDATVSFDNGCGDVSVSGRRR